MTVRELYEQLAEMIESGQGDFELLDTNAYPIIGVTTSDDDIVNEENRAYIEAEF